VLTRHAPPHARVIQAWWQARYLEDAGGHGSGTASVLLDAHARVFQCLWGAQTHFERGTHGLWRNRITGCARAATHWRHALRSTAVRRMKPWSAAAD
jgi:hypothetical protein